MNEHPEIPLGPYCYSGDVVCPHWSHKGEEGLCWMLTPQTQDIFCYGIK